MLKHELLKVRQKYFITQTLLNWIKAVAIANVALNCCCRLK